MTNLRTRPDPRGKGTSVPTVTERQSASLRRGQLRRGLAGLLLVYLALGALQAAALPPFAMVDETSHVGYALTVARGSLPTINTPIPTDGYPDLRERVAQDRAIGREHRADVWTANHPPLFYLLVGGPLQAGVDHGHPLAGLWAARGINVLFGAGALVATVALASRLLPSRPRVALIAGAWLALVPLFMTLPGAVFNDILAVLTATAALASAALILREGRTAARLAAVAAWSSAAALTRVSGLLFAVVAAGITGLAAGSAADGTRLTPARHALRDGAVVLGAVGLTSGWFYWRNFALYGGPTGRPALFTKVGMEPRYTLGEVLAHPTFWLEQLVDVFGGTLPQAFPFSPLPAVFGSSHVLGWAAVGGFVAVVAVLLLVPVAGLAVSAYRWTRGGGHTRVRLSALAPWVLLMGCIPFIVVMTADHVTNGGNPHGRYLVQVLPLMAVAAAAGWTAFAPGRHPAGILAAAGLPLAVSLLHWGLFVHLSYGAEALIGIGPPLPGGLVLVLIAAAGLATGIVLYAKALIACGVEERRA